MKKFLFLSVLLNAVIVKFDTQDNLFNESFGDGWVNQGGFGDPLGKYSARREMYKGNHAIRFKTTEKTKRLFLNQYPFSYKVKKISDFEFIVTSKKMNDYFDGTDWISAIFFQ